MSKNTTSFNSYRKKRQNDKINNPRRADWSNLLNEIRKEQEKKKSEQTNIKNSN